MFPTGWAKGGTIAGAVASPPIRLGISSGVCEVDFSKGCNFELLLTENVTFAIPRNAQKGQSGQITITQNSVVAKTLTAFHANWVTTEGQTYVFPVTLGAVFILTYYVVDSTHVWYAISKHGVA